MSANQVRCPSCGATGAPADDGAGVVTCSACRENWPAPTDKVRLFLSYGRTEAGVRLAERLEADLSFLGYAVWRDRTQIQHGRPWSSEIEDGLRSSQLVVAMLTPHAVRQESVCLIELEYAQQALKLPIVPLLAEPCDPPFVIYRLDYIDLCSWNDSEDQYKAGFRRLVDAVLSRLRGEPPRFQSWERRFPQFDFGPFLFDRRRDFCGREWLFSRIDAWRLAADRKRALLITGDPGIGKSAIVAQLVHTNPDGQVLAYHCCRSDTPETLRAARFVRCVAGMLAGRLEGYARQLNDPKVEEALSHSACETDPASAFEEGILNPLHKLSEPSGGAKYLLIDALDEALTLKQGLSILGLLSPSRLERLPGWLRVVATTRGEPDVLEHLSGLRAEVLNAQDPDNLDDVERFLTHRLGQDKLTALREATGVATNEAIRRLREKSEGNFLWARQALESIERGEFSFDRLEDLPSGLPGLYRAFFERHFPDDASYAPARKLLEVVVAAAEPLTAGQLAEASGLDPDYELPSALGRLASYLPERDGKHVVFHKSLADWLTAPATFKTTIRNFAVKARRGHQSLADLGWKELKRGAAGMSAYALRHLPAHLIGAERWEDLSVLLKDPDYLETRTERGQVFDLAMDLRRAWEAMPEDHRARRFARLVEQALRADLHFIARQPTTLFQCLWNRGWWYDHPDAALHHDPPPSGWPKEGPPWDRPVEERLSTWLGSWRVTRERRHPGFFWLRSLRPPPFPLGGAELACLRGHTRGVTSVATSPDGSRIVSGADDNTVRVWDARSGAELACLRGHTGGVTSVATSPDGSRIVSGADDKTVRVWDARSGAELACLRGHTGSVTCVVTFPDGSRIVSGARDKTVRVWDARSGECLKVIRLPGYLVPGDAAAIAAEGATESPWRAMMRNLETVIEPASGGEPIAWFPEALDNITTHPSGRVWAGSVGHHVHIIQLEGGPGPGRERPPPRP